MTEIGWACRTHGDERECIVCWRENVREGKNLEDPGLDGKVILKYFFEKWDVEMDWIDLAQDRDRLRALVNAVMNLWVP
jgi:hypothetical protein